VKRRRERLGWSQIKLGALSGLAHATISRIETGRSYYSRETVEKIARALGTSAESLYVKNITSNVSPAEIGARKIPVLDYIRAGLETVFVPGDNEVQETILTDLEHSPSSFALRVEGDSMEPKFQPGDIVVLDPAIQPVPGDYVVARNASPQASFRQYRSGGINERGEDVYELWALNPLYAPMRSDRQAIRIAGVMVEHRTYRRRR
jgi:SOS-response transcriptional repressor LexA